MKVILKSLASMLALGVLASVATGCVPTRKVMFKQEFVQGRSVRHIRNPMTEEYSLQVCDYGEDGRVTTCKESTILVERETENLL